MERQDKPLVLVWIALLLLLAATAASALLQLGAWNSVLNLGIAALKAGLVMVFFMRLRSSHVLIRLTVITGMATLAILFALSGSDYLTREHYAAPYQGPRQMLPLLR
ncbi:MAG: cytochrome C oxidase subunit IV family protein [Pseudomonadota bacterium]